MNPAITILGIGWLACLFVQVWMDFLYKTKYLKTLKPFACQMCMGFWLGLIAFWQYPLLELLTLCSMSSLSAVILYHLSNIIAQQNKGI